MMFKRNLGKCVQTWVQIPFYRPLAKIPWHKPGCRPCRYWGWREFFFRPCCIWAERQKYLGSLMRQFAIISESIALLSMTKISFYLYIIMYQFMAFDM